MNDALIFAFNLSENALERLQSICDAIGVGLRYVHPEAFGLPLGALLGMPAARLTEVSEDDSFDDPMLLMCSLDEPQFNALLQSLRFSGIPPIDLKAVLTPVNITWSARRLRDELRLEHDRLHGASER
ncbi:MAG: DUF3783 domain-containing protein [Clostridia bacterium]|nr:DUF3783 domain-containing protein [Clostridia bacterium]